MPNGFRGEAVKDYLTKIEEALDIAIEIHSRDPLRGAPTSRTGRPFIQTARNVDIPHPKNTAHIGTWETGKGNFLNIVVDEVRYEEVESQIEHRVEDETIFELDSMLREVEDICRIHFVLPQVRHRFKFVTHKFESTFPEFRQLSDEYSKEKIAFARKILNGSSEIVVWNQNNASDVHNDNKNATDNQEANMDRTIKNCEFTIGELQVRWDERDRVARTAMRTISTRNGGTRQVPDLPTRHEARLDANEIQAQMNALRTTVAELETAIVELQNSFNRAEIFFVNTEQEYRRIDNQYQSRAQDVGRAIYNFRGVLRQIYNDIPYVFDDSFGQRPDYLRWLSENHKDIYFKEVEVEARRILESLWHGEIAWADLINRPLNEVTSAENWAIAKLLMRLENYGNTDRFLQMIRDSVNADARIESIASFLSKEEQRLWHAMIPLSVDNPRVLELYLQTMRIADLRYRLSDVGGLQYVETANRREFFWGTKAGEETDPIRAKVLYVEGFVDLNNGRRVHIEAALEGTISGDFEHGGVTIRALRARASGGGMWDTSDELNAYVGLRASAHIVEFEGYVNIPTEKILFDMKILGPLNAFAVVLRTIGGHVVRRMGWDLGTTTIGGSVGVGATAGLEGAVNLSQNGDSVSVDGIRAGARLGAGITKGLNIGWTRETLDVEKE